MKKYILFFLLTLAFSNAQNSNQIIYNLKKKLNKGSESEQCKTLLKLSDEYSNSDLKTAKNYSYKALQKAKLIENDTFIAKAYNTIGNIHQYKTELDSALFFQKKALNIRLAIHDSLGIADSYNNIGIVYDTKGQYPDALKYYFKALYFYEKMKNIAKQAMANSNIGIVYKAQKEFPKALHYYSRANELFLKTDNEFGKTTASGNLGALLINFGKYNESLKYSKIAKNGYEKLGYERYVGYPLANIAYAQDSLHQFYLANKNYITSIQIQEKYENTYEVAEICNAYAICLIKQKRYQESIMQSNKGLLYAKKAKAYLLEVQSYKNLYSGNAKTGNFRQACSYANLYSIGKDSLFGNEKTKAIFELETKYQTAKKEKLLLQKEAESKQKTTYLIGLILVALLIALLGFLIYHQQKLKNKQQEQEFELKTAISQIETQNKLQEQRLSISRDLHDNIGSQLTFIISSVDNVKYAFDIDNKKLDDKLTNISSFAKETIVELRDTIWAMNSNEFTFEDLESRIHNFIEKAKEAKDEIQFSFAIATDVKAKKLTSVEGMNIYRTIQEAVNNAIKYAQATSITIAINKTETQIEITIQDNGIGFDQDTIVKGNGLRNMQKRMEDIGGKFNSQSAASGTIITLLWNA